MAGLRCGEKTEELERIIAEENLTPRRHVNSLAMPSATVHLGNRYCHHQDTAAGIAVFQEQWPRSQEADGAGQTCRFERYFGLA